MDFKLEEIENFVEKRLSKRRFLHVLGVQEEALKLARQEGISEDKALLAGIFHDAYREMPHPEVLYRMQAADLPVLDMERKNPILLHGPLAAYDLEKRFGVTDPDVLQAVRVHTTGTAPMYDLSKIIYVADLIESSRNYPGVEVLREKSKEGLKAVFLACLTHNMLHLIEKRRKIHPDTLRCWNEYVYQLATIGG